MNSEHSPRDRDKETKSVYVGMSELTLAHWSQDQFQRSMFNFKRWTAFVWMWHLCRKVREFLIFSSVEQMNEIVELRSSSRWGWPSWWEQSECLKQSRGSGDGQLVGKLPLSPSPLAPLCFIPTPTFFTRSKTWDRRIIFWSDRSNLVHLLADRFLYCEFKTMLLGSRPSFIKSTSSKLR